MVELLTAGAIKYLTIFLFSFITKNISLNKAYQDYPELKYYDFKKNGDSFLKRTLKMILSYLMFCIPYVGTAIFLMDIGLLAITCTAAFKNTDITDNALKKQMTSPEKKLSEMEYNRQYYNSKDLTDSLTIDGADKATIDELISFAKSELSTDDYEDDRIYDRHRVNSENLHLLEEVSDIVKNPVKLYEDTKDKKITNINLTDDKLEKLVIEMQKLDGTYQDDDSKEITKTFRLK